VWPTKRLLESIQAEVGGDPDWSPDSVYNILRVRAEQKGRRRVHVHGPIQLTIEQSRPHAHAPLNPIHPLLSRPFPPTTTHTQEMETFVGTSNQTRGSSGPLDVKQAPTNPQASGAGVDFVTAAEQYFAAEFGCVRWGGCGCVGWVGGRKGGVCVCGVVCCGVV
jgi:hypothetical protein